MSDSILIHGNIHSGKLCYLIFRCPNGHVYAGSKHRYTCPKCGEPLYMQNSDTPIDSAETALADSLAQVEAMYPLKH